MHWSSASGTRRPSRGERPRKGCDGYAGAFIGDPGAGCPPAPADPAGPAWRPLARASWDPARGASPWAFGGRRTLRPLLALRRQRSQRASRIWALQHEGHPSRRRSLPRWVLDPCAPSQAATCALCAQLRRPGISPPSGIVGCNKRQRIAPFDGCIGAMRLRLVAPYLPCPAVRQGCATSDVLRRGARELPGWRHKRPA
jgi:hypothetical protein